MFSYLSNEKKCKPTFIFYFVIYELTYCQISPDSTKYFQDYGADKISYIFLVEI